MSARQGYASKRQREMVKRAEAVGFYFVRLTSKRHALMRHPNGSQISISSTPSDKKAEQAFGAQIKNRLEGRQGH